MDELIKLELKEIEIAKADVYIIELVSEPGKQPILCTSRRVLTDQLLELAISGVEKVEVSAHVCSHSYMVDLPINLDVVA